MNESEPVSREVCQIREICHRRLRPEYRNHKILKIPKYWSTCRHYSCPEGRDEGRSEWDYAQATGNWENFHTIYGVIKGRRFGTSEKPDGRVVAEDKTIWSEQSGKIYPTGQMVNPR